MARFPDHDVRSRLRHGQPAGRTSVDGLREMLRSQGYADRRLPVHERLREAFPAGLRPGGVYSLTGSRTIALALMAGASQAGSWCASVGLPDLGVEAAADWGIDLERLILVPNPPVTQWLDCIAELVEVAAIVLTCAPPRLLPTEVDKLTGRLRHRGAVLVVTGAWPRAGIRIAATTTGWEGLGEGHGVLLAQHLHLEITEQHRTRSVDVTVAAA